MSNINESLNELSDLDGFVACALVDQQSGMALGTFGNPQDLNLEVAAAGNSEVIRAKNKVMSNLGIKDEIEDILISLGKQYHLIRLLKSHKNLFMYLVTSKSGNLALARHRLSEIENKIQV
ncbi:MAG: hypothetical protein R2747_05580 [Pyrinomonadaceae bacterium]